ncbi:hypothetical protein FJT64_001141 [Amphibalanus amphitrite]|uniref:Uncharacterized protein n=1 Tax=Amphibalanus amphitrite TaxID=1232801 RepID=A0A6A4V4J7_AMPAM|nr:hypothetical protein FJT64_001141 [Amphibalanus amphitrite]
MEVVAFQPVPGHVEELPDDLVKDLSQDQEILLRLSLAVQSGSIPATTACRRIGPLNHARELICLVQYLVQHYVPTWFVIRQHNACTEGSKNVYRSIELLRGLPQDIQDIIRPVISRNGYWAHPEQLLLAMVADEDREIRTAAIQHIRAAREREKEGQEVRKFTLPTINFGAQRYVDLIDWAAEKVTEPPLLRDLSVTELQGIAAAPLRVSAYPVHTQAVERAVRDVTEASLRVVGEEARHGRITACIKHRKSVPKFNSKRDVQM